MNRPLVIGVTGGIGSGKSTVCALFAELGVPFIDTDEVAREVVLPGSDGLAAVVAEFGSGVLQPDGQLDRAALRQIVFADPTLRRKLEGLLHPRIRARVRARIDALDAPYCLVGIPLLADRASQGYLDRVLVVECPEELQITRVMARDNLKREEVVTIMATQPSRTQRLSLADEIIENVGDLPAIRGEVGRLHRHYLEIARSHAPQ